MTLEIENARYNAETALGAFKSNLDQYAKKEGYNAAYHADKINQLINIRQYILALEAALAHIEAERQSAYTDGYQKGYQQAQLDNGGYTSMKAMRYFDREGARNNGIAAARRTWPELF